MLPNSISDIPNTLSWIRDLEAPQAKEQCVNWGIERDKMFEEMREQLRTFVIKQIFRCGIIACYSGSGYWGAT